MEAGTDTIPQLDLQGDVSVQKKGMNATNAAKSSDDNFFTMKGRESRGRGANDGVRVFLLSTQRLPNALTILSSTAWALTRMVENCLTHYRNAILLAREYGEITEAEAGKLHMHLLRLKEQKQTQCTETAYVDDGGADTGGSTFFQSVEKQLWQQMEVVGHGVQPALLSESLRYRHILWDMKRLAQGLLIPVNILRCRHHWLLVQEDVQLNLACRLFHYRVVVRRSPPEGLVERLWFDLWSLLGAAWRQRGRLMGIYAEGVPPIDLSSDTRHFPPPPNAPPSVREVYRKKRQEYRRGQAGWRGLLPNGVTLHEEDSYAFGPLLPHRIGITTSRHHAIRAPVLSFLRSLRVQAWNTTANTGATSTTRGDKGDSTNSLGDGNSTDPRVGNSSSGPFYSFTSPDNIEELGHVAFFDANEEDIEASRVPYVSPQWFTQIRLHCKRAFHGSVCSAVSHTFSDDTWNLAVLTVEFMLTGFSLDESCCGHVDHSAPLTGALFDDIVELLVVRHGMPLEGAQNFIYAALHELCSQLSLPLSPGDEGGATMECDNKCPRKIGPTPQRLAQEWSHYLYKTYSSDSAVLRAVAQNGLRWSRKERWKAFQAAHAFMENDCKFTSEDGENGVNIDSAECVLNELLVPMLPLCPSLCSAALKSDINVESFPAEMRQEASCNSIMEVQKQMQVWRQTTERYAVLDGGSQKSSAVKQAVVFKRFVQVLRRALLHHAGTIREKPDARHHHYHHDSTHQCGPWQCIMQDTLLRGLMERGALFSHHVDLRSLCRRSGGSGKDDHGLGEDSEILQVFPLSDVFLPTADLLSLLRKDVASICASFPTAALGFNSLDSIVSARLSCLRAVHLNSTATTTAPAPAAAEARVVGEKLLTSMKSVIRAVDLNVAVQLNLVAELRLLLQAEPAERRASLVRRYLIDVQTSRGDVEVPIPATLRGEVWAALLQVPLESCARAVSFSMLDTARPSASDRQLAVDIPRCHQYHPLLASSEGHERMWGVIKAWMLLNPKLTYWQGVDSVCAVLLAVTFTDDALVTAQLHQLTQHYISHDAVTTTSPSSKSMEDQLHQFSLLLRYCDPLLAVHLLDTVECKPELFAISWFLTLFAHGMPAAKVCLLWDFLFVYSEAYPHCLSALCLAVVHQHREQLLGQEFSTCLSPLGRTEDIDVHRTLRDTKIILRDLPPAVALMPYHSMKWGAVVRRCQVPHIDVETILEAYSSAGWRGVKHREDLWVRSGLFLVDLRAKGEVVLDSHQQAPHLEERVVGALQFPLATCHEGSNDIDSVKLSQRLVHQLATELLLQMRNLSLAAIPPSFPRRPARETNTAAVVAETVTAATQKSEESSLLHRCVSFPHVVVFMHASTAPETAAAESFAMELVRCGTPHVSILLGGFLELRQQSPHLIVVKRD